MKIAIIGAGALGCYFGTRLYESGADVRLIHHRDEYVQQVRENGIRIDSDVEGRIHANVPITTDASDVGHADVAVLFVKSHATKTALEQHGSCIGPETRVLSLQNGLRHYDVLKARFDERALGGYTRQAVTREGPGELHHVKSGVSVFGGYDTEYATELAERFEAAGVPCRIVSDPNEHIWNKQMISLAIKPTAGLTNLRNNQLDNPEVVEVMRNIIRESVQVANARGIKISEDDAMERVLSACESAHKSSMLQDIEAGRPTEINEVNGAIVEYADAEGIDVPYNRAVTQLIRAIEDNYNR